MVQNEGSSLTTNLQTGLSICCLQILQGEWVHFQGKQLCHFHCCLLCKLGSSHTGKNLLLLEQILFCKRRLIFGKALFSRYAIRKSQKLYAFDNMAKKKDGDVSILLKVCRYSGIFNKRKECVLLPVCFSR